MTSNFSLGNAIETVMEISRESGCRLQNFWSEENADYQRKKKIIGNSAGLSSLEIFAVFSVFVGLEASRWERAGMMGLVAISCLILGSLVKKEISGKAGKT